MRGWGGHGGGEVWWGERGGSGDGTKAPECMQQHERGVSGVFRPCVALFGYLQELALLGGELPPLGRMQHARRVDDDHVRAVPLQHMWGGVEGGGGGDKGSRATIGTDRRRVFFECTAVCMCACVSRRVEVVEVEVMYVCPCEAGSGLTGIPCGC